MEILGKDIKKITICSNCIMDSDSTFIEFDSDGVCNYCKTFDTFCKENPLNETGNIQFKNIINEIKEHNINKKYNCIVGISGGTDSMYLLYLAKKYGLRPLAVHFDNGWNTDTAVSNIRNVIEKLGVDLQTFVVDWEEFKDLQLSFLKASVPEVEIPTDFGINGALYRIAAEENVKYILNGNSFRAEGIVPINWSYRDNKYLNSIQNLYSKKKLKSFPQLPLFKIFYYLIIKRIIGVRLLNYIDYSKEEAKTILKNEFGWRDYGGHHHESVYTRFFMSWLAPVKFHHDRRKVTLSAKIRLGKLTREEGLEKMKEPLCSPEMIEDDKQYISKKFGISLEEFDSILSVYPKSFLDYPSHYNRDKYFQKIISWIYIQKWFPAKWVRGKFSK